ncbi:iron chelate uptake ABC transporter family permease subunit [Actinomyces sp. oral taxon 448]|uniref:iron chelate uptake ABC transporter family permease subunit n=1 Tax=Actinomyces sp. oral taxon 448 TaxID=712124 RepID=UPI000218A2ED|nr:iron chelate uptake ABC transporter family permease subunit [Actinomyces sp. oral taxon 448]EGQ73694.1 hypothetical protein HMPREF9062_1691 [Actinomyces sp. oral taxon 448 str. F0400]
MVGSLEGRDAFVLTRIAPLLLVGLVLAVGSARGLNALALGEEQAIALGADLMATRASAPCHHAAVRRRHRGRRPLSFVRRGARPPPARRQEGAEPAPSQKHPGDGGTTPPPVSD